MVIISSLFCRVEKMPVTCHSTAEDRESHRWMSGRNKTRHSSRQVFNKKSDFRVPYLDKARKLDSMAMTTLIWLRLERS